MNNIVSFLWTLCACFKDFTAFIVQWAGQEAWQSQHCVQIYKTHQDTQDNQGNQFINAQHCKCLKALNPGRNRSRDMNSTPKSIHPWQPLVLVDVWQNQSTLKHGKFVGTYVCTIPLGVSSLKWGGRYSYVSYIIYTLCALCCAIIRGGILRYLQHPAGLAGWLGEHGWPLETSVTRVDASGHTWAYSHLSKVLFSLTSHA